MLKVKTIQTHLYTVIYNQCNFTKFCYFFIVFLLISCKNESTTETIIETNVSTTKETEPVASSSKKTILFFGDSITAGYVQAIIDAVKTKNKTTKIIMAGMQLPPNMGQEYTSEFKVIFSDLAEKNNLLFIPFILKDVGGISSLNQSDGIHPTIEGHKIVANTVWEVVKPVLVK